VAGEMSFIDARPPSATVRATQSSTVLAVPTGLLHAQLQSQPAFAARFYLAIATLLSDRLRQMGSDDDETPDDLDEDVFGDDELDPGVLSGISLAGERFARILRRFESDNNA
jgi:CRP/FNR family cyclic AMP-dependent transcriptional regulator